MSKAILIIDVDYNADFENAIADITFRDERGVAPRGIKRWYSGIKAKPLPQRINSFQVDANDLFDFGYMYGRNELINELEGDEEE